MVEERVTPEQIRRSGMDVLRRELGVVNMVRFMHQFDLGRGDYAVDRHEWQDKMSVEDVLAQIQQIQKGETE